MNTLFDIELTPPKPTPPNSRCRNCIHIYHHYYNASMKYCRKQSAGNRKTAYGHKKIKANDLACPMFERIEKLLTNK